MLKVDKMIYSNPNSQPQGGFENNLIPFINYHSPAPKRCLDMLLAKYKGNPYQSEVIMISPSIRSIPQLKCKLSDAIIILITDGGLVPRNNPDRIPSSNSDRFGIYPIREVTALDPNAYEINHQGYDNSYVEQDPNRLLPLDALHELEKEGIIGGIYENFLSTTGVMTPVAKCNIISKNIADYVAALPIDAVIITSACGTSTRCGAYIGMAIEQRGIPVVQVTNLVQIASSTGISRIVKGNNICYPFGNPLLSAHNEYEYRKHLALETVQLLAEIPD